MINARLPSELYQWLRLTAFDNRISQNSIVVRALTELRDQMDAAKDGPAVAAVVNLNRLGWDPGMIADALSATGAIDIGQELAGQWVMEVLARRIRNPGTVPVSDDDGHTSLTGPGIAPGIS